MFSHLLDFDSLTLSRYYKLTDNNAILFSAVVLHPEAKLRYFEEVWKTQLS